jgi:hypothetical protein
MAKRKTKVAKRRTKAAKPRPSVDPNTLPNDLAAALKVIEQIASEDEQLFAKDIYLIRLLLGLVQDIVAALRAGTITPAQARLFVRLYQIFRCIEAILWELKRLGKGYPPEAPLPPWPKGPQFPEFPDEPEVPNLPTPPK